MYISYFVVDILSLDYHLFFFLLVSPISISISISSFQINAHDVKPYDPQQNIWWKFYAIVQFTVLLVSGISFLVSSSSSVSIIFSRTLFLVGRFSIFSCPSERVFSCFFCCTKYSLFVSLFLVLFRFVCVS